MDDQAPCVCGHIWDEHDLEEGSSAPCTIESCDCLGFELNDDD